MAHEPLSVSSPSHANTGAEQIPSPKEHRHQAPMFKNENLPPQQQHEAMAFTPPDYTSGLGGRSNSQSTPVSKAAQALARRKAVAEWVQNLLGEMLPVDTDTEFRAALRDGVLLCMLLNTVRPGTVTKIADIVHMSGTSERIRSMENVTNFLKAVRALGLPETASFNLADLESKGTEDRPRVAECLLALKRLHEARDLKTVPLGLWASPAPPAHSPLGRNYTADGMLAGQHLHFSPRSSDSPEVLSLDMARSLVATSGRTAGSAEGVINLMNQCTNMLKQRMLLSTPGGAAPSPRQQRAHKSDMNIDTVGPVLESVLSNLTQEYEKRLLAKDQEVKAAVEGQQRLQVEVAMLHHELQLTRSQLDQVKRLTGPELDETERLELEELRQKEEQMQQQVEELNSKMQLSSEAARQKEELALQLQQECEQLRSAVDDFADFNERYRAMSEENRRLYNEVQDLKGNIRVFCRVRPLGITGDNCNSCVDMGDDGELAVYNPKHRNWKTFKFDKVFGPGSSQDQVYEDTKPLIRSVLDGYNVCIFAYGQTGSGKTHTMSGTSVHEYSGRGINYRALDDLFELNATRTGEVEYHIQVQLLEIYNEQLRDLLVEGNDRGRKLELRNTQQSGSNVPDATQVEVTCTEDVLHVMEIGQRNRASAETKMNERSSRSHSVLTITVHGSNHITGVKTHGCLHLIDLAGSERILKSGADGERLEEAKHINKSLSALGDVMAALASKSTHVPYRNSKLTQLLQDSLSGQAKAMMFVHVAPEETSHGETVSTLSFGARVSDITLGQAKKNVESATIIKSKEQMSKLEQQAQQERLQSVRLREELEERNKALQQVAAEKTAMQRKLQELEAKLAGASLQGAAQYTPTERLRSGSSLYTAAPSSLADNRHTSRPGSADRLPSAQRVPLDLCRIGKQSLTPVATGKLSGIGMQPIHRNCGSVTPRGTNSIAGTTPRRGTPSVIGTPRSRAGTTMGTPGTQGRGSTIPRPGSSCGTPRSARSGISMASCMSGVTHVVPSSRPATSGGAQAGTSANSRLLVPTAATRARSAATAQQPLQGRLGSRTSTSISHLRSSSSFSGTDRSSSPANLRTSASFDGRVDKASHGLQRGGIDSRASMHRSHSENGSMRGGWR